MTPEPLLREAFERQADQAPDADPVRREILRRVADDRHSGRRTALVAVPVAAATLAAVAVLGINGVLGGTAAVTATPEPAAASTSTTSAAASTSGPSPTSSPAFVESPLLFSPVAVPPPLRETGRLLQIGPDGVAAATLTRTWQPPGAADPHGCNRLDLILWRAPVEVGESTAVSVGGTAGRWVAGGDKSVLTWPVAPGVEAQLLQIGLGLDQPAMLRIAGSLRPDERAARFPIAIGAVPAGASAYPQTYAVNRDDGSWQLSASRGDLLRVEVSSTAPANPAGAQELSVDGRPAYYLSAGPGTSLFVALEGGTGLWVRSSRPGSDPAEGDAETLVRIAQAVSWEAPAPF